MIYNVFLWVSHQLPQMPSRYDPQLGDLIKSMLCKRPEDRPDVKLILRQPYIKRQIAMFLEATKEQVALTALSLFLMALRLFISYNNSICLSFADISFIVYFILIILHGRIFKSNPPFLLLFGHSELLMLTKLKTFLTSVCYGSHQKNCQVKKESCGWQW